jgi:hypothetical protein
MAEEINSRTARQMRLAIKKIGENGDVSDVDTALFGDEVLICAPMSAGPNDRKHLVIKRNGQVVAATVVTMGTIKRLKGEMQWWKQFHTGALWAFSHGNQR